MNDQAQANWKLEDINSDVFQIVQFANFLNQFITVRVFMEDEAGKEIASKEAQGTLMLDFDPSDPEALHAYCAQPASNMTLVVIGIDPDKIISFPFSAIVDAETENGFFMSVKLEGDYETFKPFFE